MPPQRGQRGILWPAVDAPAPEVTVAIPVKDRRERMLRCLDAVLAQDHPSYEVLVLDNGSSDGTAEACRERARKAAIPVRVDVIEGTVGAVRNEGARRARGPIVAFTDSDCLPEPGWLSAGLRAFADPRVGVVTGTTLPEDPPPHGDWPATIEVTEPSGRFESCNVFFRRDAFTATEGFHEDIGHFWEDTAAGLAMMRRGWRHEFVPQAVVRHDVTYPGLWWHVRRMQRHQNMAAVLARYPELRRELLWCRLFLRPRNAMVVGALFGLALSRWDRRALVLAAPYAWFRRPRELHPLHLRAVLRAMVYDVAIVVGVVRGGVRYRRIVL